MVEIPRERDGLKKLVTDSVSYDIGLALVATAVPGVAAYKAFVSGEWTTAIVTGAACFIGCGIAVGKHLVLWSTTKKKDSVHDLCGCLHTLYDVLCGDYDGDPGVRLTIHAPIGNERLRQVLDYVGNREPGGGKGRTFAVQSGIIGRAFRLKDPVCANRINDSHTEYVQELVNTWNYTAADARRLDPAAMSWMAIPLMIGDDERGTVIGVVYADAIVREFFTPERQAVSVLACKGIARFVGIRYE
jgi:hypothetical protein